MTDNDFFSVAMLPKTTRVWAMCGLCIYAFVGCDLPGKPNPSDRARAPQEERSFEILFRNNCAGCHGAEGRLGPAPPLNDPLFLSIIPPDLLLGVVADGRPNTLMPAFRITKGGTLTDEQIHSLADGLKSQWASKQAVLGTTPSYVAEPGGNLANGMRVFAEACAGCHGQHGTGGSAGAINNPTFLTLMSDQALRRIIITGRPDLGMPDYADRTGRPDDFKPLTAQGVSDLVAVLESWRSAKPAGTKGD